MDHITDRVYIGNLQAALNLTALKREGITHILQVAGGFHPAFPSKFTYKTISIGDNSQSSLLRHFPAVIAFIKQGAKAGGVLVHCYAGVSRCATCVIAYLMQEKDMSFQ